MAVLVRVTDFVPSTLIKSQEMDDELNQIINLLSGVSTNKNTALKFSDGSTAVLSVDQLGAGLIQQWLQNGTEKARIENDGSLKVGTGGAVPVAAVIGGPDASGSNVASVALSLHGGKSTGNALPGHIAARYPLVGASGSTLQSLSSNSYPLESVMFTSASGVTVVNTTTETTLLDAGSAGSTKTIEAGLARVGRVFRLTTNVFQLTTTGTPTGRLRVKIGSVTVADTTAVAFPTAALNTSGRIVCDLWVTAGGASGSVTATIIFEYGDSTTGTGETNLRCFYARGAASGTIDFTAAQAIDLTWQWGTASASNSINVGPTVIPIAR